MKSAHSCRICGRWLEGDWNMSKDPEERDELERQMGQGHCDGCEPDLGRDYLEKVTRALTLSPEDEEKLSDLIHRADGDAPSLSRRRPSPDDNTP